MSKILTLESALALRNHDMLKYIGPTDNPWKNTRYNFGSPINIYALLKRKHFALI